MKPIHVECLPDEALVKKLGFTRKMVTHHAGKSRVFTNLKSVVNHLAMVDEDPGSPKSSYEKVLVKEKELHGLVLFSDKSGNKILQLEIKLEDWIIKQCKLSGIKTQDFGLPDTANELHEVINQRINNFEKLIDSLVEKKNAGIELLKSWLN